MNLARGILDETARARKTNEESARAARDSVKLMRQQLEEQAGLGNFIVESTIDRAIAAIEAILQPEPLRNFNVSESRSRLDLLIEQQAEPAVTHAARSVVSPETFPQAVRALQSLKDALAKFLLAKHNFTQAPANIEQPKP